LILRAEPHYLLNVRTRRRAIAGRALHRLLARA
jgi:hypothetical protein